MLIKIGKGGGKEDLTFFLTLAIHKKALVIKQSWGEKKIVFAHVKNKMKYEPYVNYAEIF